MPDTTKTPAQLALEALRWAREIAGDHMAWKQESYAGYPDRWANEKAACAEMDAAITLLEAEQAQAACIFPACHHNGCPAEVCWEPEQAQAAQAVPAEPVAEFLGRRRTPEGTTEFWGVMLCDPMQDPPKYAKLYTAPQPRQAQAAQLDDINVADMQAAQAVPAEPDDDDQAWDREAERLTAEAFGPGGGINPNATSIDDLFLDAPHEAAKVHPVDAHELADSWMLRSALSTDQGAANAYRECAADLRDYAAAPQPVAVPADLYERIASAHDACLADDPRTCRMTLFALLSEIAHGSRAAVPGAAAPKEQDHA